MFPVQAGPFIWDNRKLHSLFHKVIRTSSWVEPWMFHDGFSTISHKSFLFILPNAFILSSLFHLSQVVYWNVVETNLKEKYQDNELLLKVKCFSSLAFFFPLLMYLTVCEELVKDDDLSLDLVSCFEMFYSTLEIKEVELIRNEKLLQHFLLTLRMSITQQIYLIPTTICKNTIMHFRAWWCACITTFGY